MADLRVNGYCNESWILIYIQEKSNGYLLGNSCTLFVVFLKLDRSTSSHFPPGTLASSKTMGGKEGLKLPQGLVHQKSPLCATQEESPFTASESWHTSFWRASHSFALCQYEAALRSGMIKIARNRLE
ncbi:hypothetical protein JTE90_009823 [Oedothorax gibbosus]|uniref:Uncharacterized protein n=1 Tax=Oedothorax gibbosus TaxID=931172 RepID=A0AAV6UDE3_9ARAC|nr:hypothetical protein JTE90_009823 [Oedothorax gibbosus]